MSAIPALAWRSAFRRAVEKREIAVEDWTNFAMVLRLHAGALGVPFLPTATLFPGDLADQVDIRTVTCPFTGEELSAVPALNPDVAIIHAHCADEDGNVQLFGLPGDTLEGANASRRIICTVEEIVSRDVVRSRPDRTILPGFRVNAVSLVPWGAHPSYVDGIYDRDDEFYQAWDKISRTPESLSAWLEKEVFGSAGFEDYVERLGGDRLKAPQGQGASSMSAEPSEAERFVALAAREIANGAVCFVGIGVPSLAAITAKKTHAPDMVLIYESGAVDALPPVPPLSTGSPSVVADTAMVTSCLDVFSMLQRGVFDLGMLSAAQVDRFGNLNSTALGPYATPKVRLVGSGGAHDIAVLAKEIMIMMPHDPAPLRGKGRFRHQPRHLARDDRPQEARRRAAPAADAARAIHLRGWRTDARRAGCPGSRRKRRWKAFRGTCRSRPGSRNCLPCPANSSPRLPMYSRHWGRGTA